jgi:hypothetical protein
MALTIDQSQVADPVKLQDGSGTSVTVGQKTMSSSLPVTIASDQGSVTILQPNLNGSGNITAADSVLGTPFGTGSPLSGTPSANSTVTLALNGGETTWVMNFSGTFAATLFFEQSFDSTNGVDGQWIGCNGFREGTSNSTLATNTTAVSVWKGSCSGAKYVRARCCSYTSGTVVATIRASVGEGQSALYSPIPTGTNTIGAVTGSGTFTIQGSQGSRNSGTITTASSVVGPFSCQNLNVATVTVNGTYAGVTFTFEGTDDGTNFYPINASRNDIGVIENTPVLPSNTSRSWDMAIGGYTQIRVRATAWTSGTANIGVTMQAMPYEPCPAVTVSPVKATYSAASTAFTPGTAPTDIFTITGSATKTVRILRIEFSATQTTAGINNWFIAKRSTANSAGTSAAVTAVPHDSGSSAATATVLQYTANPTPGTLVGNIRSAKILAPAPSSLANPTFVWDFESGNTGVPPVLRGATQVLAVNFNGAALPAGLSVQVNVTWTEE